MEEVFSQPWFLRKHHDGSVFGPISFDQLSGWASAAQVAPHDLVSTDQQTWLKAPMLAQLAMDWLVEVTSEHYYGPTTVGAIQEFIRLGDIKADAFLINSCDGTRRQIGEMPALFKANATASKTSAGDAAVEPAAAGISIRLQERIPDLEQTLREERRALAEAEKRYEKLEEKYNACCSVAARPLRPTSVRPLARPSLPPSSSPHRRSPVAIRANFARTTPHICHRAQSAPRACRAQ